MIVRLAVILILAAALGMGLSAVTDYAISQRADLKGTAFCDMSGRMPCS